MRKAPVAPNPRQPVVGRRVGAIEAERGGELVERAGRRSRRADRPRRRRGAGRVSSAIASRSSASRSVGSSGFDRQATVERAGRRRPAAIRARTRAMYRMLERLGRCRRGAIGVTPAPARRRLHGDRHRRRGAQRDGVRPCPARRRIRPPAPSPCASPALVSASVSRPAVGRRRSIVGAQPGATLQQVEDADNDGGDSQDDLCAPRRPPRRRTTATVRTGRRTLRAARRRPGRGSAGCGSRRGRP